MKSICAQPGRRRRKTKYVYRDNYPLNKSEGERGERQREKVSPDQLRAVKTKAPTAKVSSWTITSSSWMRPSLCSYISPPAKCMLTVPARHENQVTTASFSYIDYGTGRSWQLFFTIFNMISAVSNAQTLQVLPWNIHVGAGPTMAVLGALVHLLFTENHCPLMSIDVLVTAVASAVRLVTAPVLRTTTTRTVGL